MTSVVVVGSGIAGLLAALHAADRGRTVTLVTKSGLDASNTACAQGGIAAVTFADDHVRDHVRDTLTAGAGACDRDAVSVLAGAGAEAVDELIARGVRFDREADGAFVRGLEAAHSYPRILHAGGDATGRVIEQALVSAVQTSPVRVLEDAFLIDLCVDGTGAARRVTGVELDHADMRRTLRADAVVLATGGAGRLYAHTTNPAQATGDGVAAAIRAGVAVADLEFVQFHPTVLAGPAPFLVSEAVRGEGAVLRDRDGHRFMREVHPDAELAPRDVVARAVADQAARQGSPVVLDATAIGDADPHRRERWLAHRFPTIDGAVRAQGWDWAREPIPVTPAAHYLMGGIVTDLDGRTSLPGLFAAGECARTGVHGANRLASNSLLEGAVFGARAGDAASAVPDSGSLRPRDTAPSVPVTPAEASTPPPVTGGELPGPVPPFSRAALQRLMWAEAGLSRDAAGLARAARVLEAWAADMRRAATISEREDENLLVLARAVVAAARARPESLGAHHRRDDPRAAADDTRSTTDIHETVLTEAC